MGWNDRVMINTRLPRCASPLVIAAFFNGRLIPQGLRALHPGIFDNPV
jgi:hypothetical protein